jgi:hypothetical protein
VDKNPLLYNQTNSGLESLTFAGLIIDIRINGAAFDKTGTSGWRIAEWKKRVKSVENQWTVAAFSTENILDASERQ